MDRPDETLMVSAIQAGQSALCAIELPTFSLLGWAMETAAENVLTAEVTRDTRTDEQMELFEFLAIAGNNGWHDSFAETFTPGISAKLRASEAEEPVILGMMLARGASASAGKQLQHLAKKA